MSGKDGGKAIELTPGAGAPEAAPEPGDEPADDELLKRYRSHRDQAAFSLLVKRHAPLVWRVCHGILGHTHDAEDALQATFLVLVRRAGSVRWQRSISAWLYEVSHRVAKKSRATAARRIVEGRDEALVAPSSPAQNEAEADRRLAIHEEVARLPELLRLPVVMCYLEGLTNAEAARRIGCSEGTIVSRLARAREKLRRRLASRSIALVGGAALSEWFAEGAAAAPLPEVLPLLAAGGASSVAPSQRAVQLAREVTRQMAGWQLLRMAAAIALGTVIATSLVVYELGWWSIAGEPDAAPAARPPVNAMAAVADDNLPMLPFDQLDPASKAALGALEGEWVLEEWIVRGNKLPVTPEIQRIRFDRDRCVVFNVIGNRPGPVDAQVVVDPKSPESALDLFTVLADQRAHLRCLYEISGDRLRLAAEPDSLPRPTGLSGEDEGPNPVYLRCVFRRLPPEEKPKAQADE